MEYSIEFNKVWKSFQRGERATLGRDIIVGALRRISGKKWKKTHTEPFWVLKDICFAVRRGEMIGIVGPNGVGKTTILNLIARILKPNKGRITTQGRISSLMVAGSGFQTEFTGRENIYLNGIMMGMHKRDIDKKFNSIVEFAGYGFPGYEKFIDTPLKRYSPGMFFRLGFAIAAHVEPDILLVDEILGVGDFMFQQRCFEYMNNLKKSNITAILVSHNMHQVAKYCDSAILLNNSGIATKGEPYDVINNFEREMSKSVNLGKNKDMASHEFNIGACIEKVEFKNKQRNKNGISFNYTETIELGFDYKCLSYPLDDLTFSLAVYRKIDECMCFKVFSHLGGIHPDKKEGHIKLAVNGHNLLPGEYTFDIEIRDLKSNMPLAVYREPEILINHVNSSLSVHSCGIYQPKDIHWDFS